MTATRVFAVMLLPRLHAFVAHVAVGVRSLSALRASDDAFAEYSAATTFLFPGQGAQSLGMGVEVAASVPAAKALYEQASEILGYDLLVKCSDGPKEELDSTAVSQPAIFVSSMAAVAKLRAEEGDAAVEAATCAMGASLVM